MEDMKDIIKPGHDIMHSLDDMIFAIPLRLLRFDPLGCFEITQKIDTKEIEL